MTVSTTVLDFGKYRTSGMSTSFSQILWCLIEQEEQYDETILFVVSSDS